MKKEITEDDVILAKEKTRVALKNDAIDLSYITIEFLSADAIVISEEKLDATYYANSLSVSSDANSQPIWLCLSNSTGTDACGHTPFTIPGYYTRHKIGNCISSPHVDMYRLTNP